MSNNGWSNDPSDLVEIGVPGVSDTGAVRSGVVANVFRAFILDFHRTVEPLTTINGYRSRALNQASGGIESSNHRSGTALDLNGYRHPYEPSAARPYDDGFTAAQTAQIRALLAKYGVIKWGMDFPNGYRDAMHFEIRGNTGEVTLASNRITNSGTVPTVPSIPGITPIDPEDDMPYSKQELKEIIAETLRDNLGDGNNLASGVGAEWWVRSSDRRMAQTLRNNIGDVAARNASSWWSQALAAVLGREKVSGAADAAKLAAALAPLLNKATGGPTVAEIETALKKVLNDAKF